MNIQEQNYLKLLSNILDTGSVRTDRTGVGTKGIFGTQLKFSLEDNVVPCLTTKKIYIKGVIEELLFFLRGETNTKKLEAQGVNIWQGNTSRQFLDKKGLINLPEGDMGKGYGFQWRKFGEVKTKNNYIQGIDQLANVIHKLKTNPTDRRIIISAWNPQQLSEMALEPCHILCQFYADKNNLSCQWYQRSVDSFLGLPFNLLSYAVLTHIIAKTVGMEAKELIFTGGDTHIYLNHINQVETQISRNTFNFPKIKINKDLKSVTDIENLEFKDFEFINYISHPSIKAQMAI
jgi:thymidylate synthase